MPVESKMRKSSDEQGFLIPNPKLEHWKPLMEEWSLLVSRYCRMVKEDAPYVHKERPILGLLAGAAWRLGWVALEEFSLEKDERDDRRGRADLWLQTPSSGSEYLEAKFGWMDCVESVVPDSRDCLEAACRDAQRVIPDGDEVARKIGIAFVCMQTYDRRESPPDEQIADCIRGLGDDSVKGGLHATAWCFPSEARGLKFGGKQTQYSGVILMARIV